MYLSFIQAALVNVPFGYGNMYTQFLPRPARKESNVPRLKSRKGLTVLVYILCSLLPCLVRSLFKYFYENICIG